MEEPTDPTEPADAAEPGAGADSEATLPAEGPTKDVVLDVLRNVYDPELGINIVDLGLVYGVDIRGGAVHITYSLTTMGCPIGPLIEAQMQQFLTGVPGVEDVTAEMVLRPAWSPEMMSEEAKAALGVF